MNRGIGRRQLVSGVGELRLGRRYWQCRCGADGSYAADAAVGIAGHLTVPLQKHVCRLTADVAFAKAADHLNALLEVSLSPETLRTVSHERGREMARHQPKDEAAAQLFRHAAGAVAFTVDAGKVNTRERGWKDLKIGVIQKRAAGEPVSPGDWPDQRLPGATATVAFARIATAKDFAGDGKKWLRRLGVRPFGEVPVLGDGADWIWKQANRVLTGGVQTLDFFHGCEHLGKAAERIHGEGTPGRAACFDRGKELLLTQGWTGVCAWVDEQLRGTDGEEQSRRQRLTDRVLLSFAKHATRLNYAERLASGRAIGSGSVEGQAKTLGLRLKARGARWNIRNVRKMASLVNVRNSSQWDTYWNAV